MRLEKLLSENDFHVIETIASDYIENQLGTEVWLYSIDRSQTPTTGSFEESLSTEIHFYEPIAIPSIIEWRPTTNSAYDVQNVARFEENGNFLFHTLNKTLKLMPRMPLYGDFIAYEHLPKEFTWFKIIDDNKKNYDNAKTWGSFRSIYRTIECVPVDKGELEFVK